MSPFNWKVIFRINFLLMQSGGMWPKSDKYELNFYLLYTIFLLSLVSFGDIIFQSAKILFLENIEEMAEIIFVLLSKFGTLFKAVYVVKNIRTIKKLAKAMDDNCLFRPKNQRQIMLIKPILKIWKISLATLWILTTAGISFWTFFPITDKTYKDHRLPFSCWYPYNTNKSPFYQITYVYQIASIIYMGLTTNCANFLISSLCAFIGSQFDLLCDNIKNLGFDSQNKTKQHLFECIEHYQEVMRFAKISNKFVDWIAFIQFIVSASSIGITMFQLTKVVPLSFQFFSILFFELGISLEIFLYCWFGHQVQAKSDQLSYSLFESNWTSFPIELKKILVVLIIRWQKPVRPSAFNLFYLSMDTFVAIFRTAYSYFTLLNGLSD